jgi:hypothetical protein
MEQHTKEIKHQNVRYKYRDGGCLFGYVKDRVAEVPDKFPWISWKGALMPYELYQKIIRFFEWSQKEHKSEALVHLYYNDKTEEWMAWAPPQRSMGMTVKSLDDHENFKQSSEFKGFIKIGTAHHHCTTSAFQSGTDSNDECTGNGLHYTIGKLDEAKYDTHFRAVFNGNMQKVHPYYWIGLPDHLAKAVELAPELMEEAYGIAMGAHAPKEMEVPELWKSNFFHESAFSQNTYNGRNYNSYTPGSEWDPVKKEWVRDQPNTNGPTSTPNQSNLPKLATSQPKKESENTIGLNNEDMADLALSNIVREFDLGASQIRRIAAAIANEHYRTGIKGEDEIEQCLTEYGLSQIWLLSWLDENEAWARGENTWNGAS